MFGKRQNNTNRKTAKTVQQSIPIRTIYENGVIETTAGTFTKLYKLEDVNFRIAPDEEQASIFLAFGRVLNSFTKDTRFQFVIHNRTADKRSTISDVMFTPQKDMLNPYRQEMNTIMLENIRKGRSNIAQDKYLCVAVDSDSDERAMTKFDEIDRTLIKMFRGISRDAQIRAVTLEERLKIMFDIYNQDGNNMFYNKKDPKTGAVSLDIDALMRGGISPKDVIGPSSMYFESSWFKLGETYGKALFLQDVPSFLSTEFVADLTDLTCNMLFSMQYQPIEMTEAVKIVKTMMINIDAQITAMQKTAGQQGYTLDLIPPELKRKQQNTRDLMTDMVARDQKMYFMTITLVVFASSKEELENNMSMVRDVASKHMCPFRPLSYEQEDGLISALPLCVNRLYVKMMRTTESASVFLPYSTQELHQKNGIYYGLNSTSKNMILYDRLMGENFNGLIIGKSGTGKSMAAKLEMLSVLLRRPDSVVYVIDPEREYVELAKALYGEVVTLAPGSQTYVNPLDMDLEYGDNSDPLGMKTDFVISMMEIMIGKDRAISPEGKSIIARCVHQIYAGYLDHLAKERKAGHMITCDKNAAPTLSDLYNAFNEQEEPAAHTLAQTLELYAMNMVTFSHRSNVNTDTRFLVYDIRDLGTGQKELGLHVCLNDIWNKMLENRKKGIYTWFYVDEFYLLLQSDSAAEFLMQIWKRARKWRGVPTGIMQNTEDLLRTATSRNIINNTSFIQMLSLPKIDRMNISQLLGVSDSQLAYITDNQPGHGLIYNTKTILPFENDFPTDTKIYQIVNSSGRE